MDSIVEPLASWTMLLARSLIAMVFLVSGVHKAIWYEKAVTEFRDASVPLIEIALPGTILLHLIGSLCLIGGVYMIEASLALAAFTAVATVKVHGFWRFDGEKRLIRSRIALGNLALIGGLLLLAVVDSADLS